MNMRMAAALCGAALLFATASHSAPKSLVKIQKISKIQAAKIASLGYDVVSIKDGYAEAVLDKAEAAALSGKGYSLKTLIADLDKYVEQMKGTQNKTDAYYNYAKVETVLGDWAKKYSEICRLESIGKSCENKDIWALKISDNPQKNEQEPAVLLMGAHHSREWPSIEVPMAVAEKLLTNYSENPEIRRLVDTREIWIVPVVNPDGVIYSMEKSKFWRKNRRKNSDGTFGVDLNRNYGYQWGDVGSSNSGYSDTYHGPHAFSEPESIAIKKLAEREKFQASISYHTYSELILYPFGYAHNVNNPDSKIFVKLAEEMSKMNGYRPQNSAQLYPAMGDLDDYLYGSEKVLSFTFELCKSFIPPANQIPSFTAPNVEAALHLIDKSGTYAMAIPGNNPGLANNLDFDDALTAVSDINAIFGNERNIVMRNEVLKQLDVISKRLAQLTVEDLKHQSTEKWERLRSEQTASLAVSYVRTRLLFDEGHNPGSYGVELINSVKNK